MLSRAPVAGCAPPITILWDSSSEGPSRTCEARAHQRPTYSPNGSLGFCFVATRSARFGTRSRMKEYCPRNAWLRSFHVLMVAISSEVNHLSVGPVRLFWNKRISNLSSVGAEQDLRSMPSGVQLGSLNHCVCQRPGCETSVGAPPLGNSRGLGIGRTRGQRPTLNVVLSPRRPSCY